MRSPQNAHSRSSSQQKHLCSSLNTTPVLAAWIARIAGASGPEAVALPGSGEHGGVTEALPLTQTERLDTASNGNLTRLA
jgi:hypothetical protein